MKVPQLSRGTRAVLSLTILALLILWIGPEELLTTLRAMHWEWMAAAIAFEYVSIALGTYNVYLLTHALLPDVPGRVIIRAYLQSWAVGMVAPGKVGDFAYSHFMSGAETNLAPGLAVVLVDKIITFLCTAALAVVGLAIFVSASDAALGAVFAVLATVAALAILLNPKLRAFVRARVLRSWASRVSGFTNHVQGLLFRRPGLIALNVALTFVRMAVMGFSVMLALRAFGESVGLVDVVIIQSIVQLTALIPITLSGLGVRQGVAVALFEEVASVPAAAVLSQSLVLTAVVYVNVGIVFALIGTGRER